MLRSCHQRGVVTLGDSADGTNVKRLCGNLLCMYVCGTHCCGGRTGLAPVQHPAAFILATVLKDAITSYRPHHDCYYRITWRHNVEFAKKPLDSALTQTENCRSQERKLSLQKQLVTFHPKR